MNYTHAHMNLQRENKYKLKHSNNNKYLNRFFLTYSRVYTVSFAFSISISLVLGQIFKCCCHSIIYLTYIHIFIYVNVYCICKYCFVLCMCITLLYPLCSSSSVFFLLALCENNKRKVTRLFVFVISFVFVIYLYINI